MTTMPRPGNGDRGGRTGAGVATSPGILQQVEELLKEDGGKDSDVKTCYLCDGAGPHRCAKEHDKPRWTCADHGVPRRRIGWVCLDHKGS